MYGIGLSELCQFRKYINSGGSGGGVEHYVQTYSDSADKIEKKKNATQQELSINDQWSRNPLYDMSKIF